MTHINPIKEAQDCMSGRLDYERLSDGAKHLCAVPIFKAAAYVLNGTTQAERRERIGKAPPTMARQIDAEARRIWQARRAQKKSA